MTSNVSHDVRPATHSMTRVRTTEPHWITRYGFYAFVFSLTFESADVGFGAATISRLLGILFVMTTPLSAGVCYRRPPQAFWFFAAYLLILFVWAGIFLLDFYPNDGLRQLRHQRLFTLTQLMVMFWLSYNMLRDQRVANGTLWALAVSCLLLAVLQMIGLTASETHQSRDTAFEANPNVIAVVLSVGSLALMGLSYGKMNSDLKSRALFWLGSAIILVSLVRTGSRGALVALVLGFIPYLLHGRNFASKVKLGLLAVLAVGVMAAASFQIEAVRVRWEKTIERGDLAGRETIFENAWKLFLEKPIAGWGTSVNTSELGLYYFGRQGALDTHNLYLFLLTEAGLLGALPFLFGLWLCWRSAWRARWSVLGVVPLSMLMFFLVVNLKGTYHNRKLFWLVLAYSLASGTYSILRQPVGAAVQRLRSRSVIPGARQIGRPAMKPR